LPEITEEEENFEVQCFDLVPPEVQQMIGIRTRLYQSPGRHDVFFQIADEDILFQEQEKIH